MAARPGPSVWPPSGYVPGTRPFLDAFRPPRTRSGAAALAPLSCKRLRSGWRRPRPMAWSWTCPR
eukprot:11562025-Heterocapsa_arctica.AAC.1